MIQVTCIHCHATLDIPDQYAGQLGKCNKCGGSIQVPKAQNREGFTPNPPKKSGSCLKGCAIVAIGFFVVLVIFANVAGPTPEELAVLEKQRVEEQQERKEAKEQREAEKAAKYAAEHPPLTQAHIDAIMKAFDGAEKFEPQNIRLTDTGYVVAEIHSPLNVINGAEEYGRGAVLLLRNTVYPMDGASHDWNYRISIYGPSPGPDLVSVIGSARMSHYDGSISWSAGKP